MKILAALCNVAWFLFTCLVLLTDGFPTRIGYILATLLTLLVPLVTLAALFPRRAGNRPTTGAAAARGAAIAGNVALLAYLMWVLLFLPPHPAEEGYVPYVVLAVLTPVVSLIALLLRRTVGQAPGATGTGDSPVGPANL